MNDNLNSAMAFLAVIIVVAISLSLLLVIVYTFERAQFEDTLDEMKRNATEIAKESDE